MVKDYKSSENMSADRLLELKEEIDSADPSELEGEIRAGYDNSIQRKKLEFADESETVGPFTTEVKGPAKASIEKIHQGRTERAQTVDEQYNAPVTTDEEKWVENKNRYDYPGVDTIPQKRIGRRSQTAAKRAKKLGAADRVEQKGSAKTLAGKFSPDAHKTYGKGENVVRLQNTAQSPERTLAHEVGHAFDYYYTPTKTVDTPDAGEQEIAQSRSSSYGLSEKLFQSDEVDRETIEEEALELSKRARGGFDIGKKGLRQEQYRRQHTELTADAVSQAIIEPRAAKREAPNLFNRVEELAEEKGFADIFGDESDPMDIF